MEITGNFFDGIEQMITEAALDERVTSAGARMRAVATRDICQLVLRIIDSHSLKFKSEDEVREIMVDRLTAAGSGIAAAMGLFVAIGCMKDNTPENRAAAYVAISEDAEAFSKIIAEAMSAYVTVARKAARQ